MLVAVASALGSAVVGANWAACVTDDVGDTERACKVSKLLPVNDSLSLFDRSYLRFECADELYDC